MASPLRRLLLPASALYGAAVALRNLLYDRGIIGTTTFPLPLLTVGNIAVGGTGKTPFVELLLRLLGDDGRFAVVSRGYKRRSNGLVVADKTSNSREIGDEPWQLKQKFPAVPVVVDSDRRRALRHLLGTTRQPPIEGVLLDDAYQYRRIEGDLRLVLIAYRRLPTDDHLLPAGRLREGRKGLRRADSIILTSCPPSLTAEEGQEIAAALDLLPSQRLFFATTTYLPLQPYTGGTPLPLPAVAAAEHILLVVAIAQPAALQELLAQYTSSLHVVAFRDHHTFSRRDIAKITRRYSSLTGRRYVITTEKDAARLRQYNTAALPFAKDLYTLPIATRLLFDGEEALRKRIMTYINKYKR